MEGVVVAVAEVSTSVMMCGMSRRMLAAGLRWQLGSREEVATLLVVLPWLLARLHLTSHPLHHQRQRELVATCKRGCQQATVVSQ
jgi:hypothetical protein